MMKACGLQMIDKMAKISEIGITERHIASDGFKCEHALYFYKLIAIKKMKLFKFLTSGYESTHVV